MKFNKYLLGLGLSCSLVLTACEDVIDLEPEFQLEITDSFTTLDEHEYSLTGTYARLRATAYFGTGAQTTGTWASLPDMMGEDLVRTSEDLSNWATQVNWNYTTDENDLEEAWLAAYAVVLQANLTLQNIDRFEAAEPGRVNRIKGQALALRAMAHFDLLRFWGESYDRNSEAKGVPYKTSVDKFDLPARLTVRQTYDNIFADLEDAEELLGNVDRALNSSTNRAYLDQTAVKALLARVNLYAKQYEAAETYATQVIEAIPLATRDNFSSVWLDNYPANREVIWKVTYSAGEGSPATGVHISSTNRNRFRPSVAVMGLYDQANDVRYTSYFNTRSLGDNTRRIVNKFVGRGTSITALSQAAGRNMDNLVDWKIFRTGEMYLIRAEARAMQGGAKLLAGLSDLNELRAARIANYVPALNLTQQGLLDAIATERRKELFAEGHRWFDIKRTTRSVTRTESDATTTMSLAPGAREWAWPVPQGEVDANANLEQTTGYN
ncbi:RagB/SusD family nutrient uptake outer membrane protein [Pontibacter sp. SGAir0037]|uniref:RagB/SusD family nutrient uptake outer membrane protein n=1 Tax=Pontibacter sp. SGAir0037 TaxID=2571030 RepID=UPI0010CD5284|nr:RagB/SusD family nutrient uptake outer membrane protein [Pontibacter sp. SGAir0037]QCR21060.1 RagB/SusD family nutrient uptake outer membrane protein [Pontibacter sp. SGAir0037]